MASRENRRAGKRQVALFGTFDTDNFGDCLFLLIVKQQLFKRLENVELLLFSPTSKTAKIADYPVVHGFDRVGNIFGAMLPAFVIAGGALLSTEHVLFSYPEVRLTYPYSLKCWLLPAMIASLWNCPLVLNGVGLGPFNPDYSDLAAKYLNRATVCGVRDGVTQEFLNNAGVKSEIVPDCGILVPHLATGSEWEDRYNALRTEFGLPEKYTVVQASLYLESQLEVFAERTAEAVQQTGLPAVLVPICHHLNDRVASRLMRRVFHRKGVRTILIDRILSTLETSAMLSRASLFVGTSLHGALVTLAFRKPVVSFSLSKMKKNLAVLTVLGAEDCVVNEPSQLPAKIHAMLNASVVQCTAGLDKARTDLAVFFDRITEVIWSQSGRPLKQPLTVRMSSGEVLCDAIGEDLDRVKMLCTEYRKSIPLVRRCGAVLVRNNRSLSEWYDRISHWMAVRRAIERQ